MRLNGPHSQFEGSGKEEKILAPAGNETVVVQYEA
jgi:hypothetical protein